jgi:hypothetical protein
MTLESTPAQRKAFTAYYHGQMDGTGPKPSDLPDGGPRASKLTDHIKARLRGDAMPDTFSDAPDGIDQDVWKAAQESVLDPNSPDYHLASAFLDLARQLADLRAGGPA